MKTLSIVCEEKYESIAMYLAGYFARVGNGQNLIRVLTPKQYLQINEKTAVFNDDEWLFSLGKNECTKIYKHLVFAQRDLQQFSEGLFWGHSGHVAIAYHEIECIPELLREKGQEFVRLVDAVKERKIVSKDFYSSVKKIFDLNYPTISSIVKIQDEKLAIDIIYLQKAVDAFLSSDSKGWMVGKEEL